MPCKCQNHICYSYVDILATNINQNLHTITELVQGVEYGQPLLDTELNHDLCIV